MGLGRVLLTAATGRTNVRLAAVAVIAAAVLGSWKLLAAAAALYGALVAIDLAHPERPIARPEGSRPHTRGGDAAP